MSIPLSTRQRFLVEWYHPDATTDALHRRVAAVSAHADRADGAPVVLLTTFLLPTDEVVFGVFAADSAESVAEACRRSGYPAGRVSAAVEGLVGGPDAPVDGRSA